MKYQDIPFSSLCRTLPQTINEARVQTYLHEHVPELTPVPLSRPCMVICPGGGYSMTSHREAEPVALPFFTAGYQVFVLRYSCKPDRFPAQLLQLTGLIAHIRQNAGEYGVASSKIAVIGFSAGGHLAASAGILYKEPVVANTHGVDSRLCRPDAMVLSYPVIKGVENAHLGSFNALLGEDADDSSRRALSLDERVDCDTAQAFIWHTLEDAGVPVENSLDLARAMRAAGVPFELHIYPSGPHGLSMADKTSWSGRENLVLPHVATWFSLCLEWLDSVL